MSETEIIVIKIGGSVLSSDAESRRLIACLRPKLIPGRAILVHGGGNDINFWLGRLGVEHVFSQGQRVTYPDTMKVVEMVLSGLMNKKLVGMLEEAGCPAAGISGRDAGLARADILDIKLGRVGTVTSVNPGILFSIMEGGFIPVVSPVSSGPDGEPVNVNADFFAARAAAALGASELNLVTASGGVISGGSLLGSLECGKVPGLIEEGVATEGMIPKLRAAVSAREGGVGKVNILNYEGITGTCII